MKLTVYNFKGGVGKTSISLNMALTLDYGIVTNDIYSPLEDILGKKRVLKISPTGKINKLPDDYDIIFDLGGYLDERAVPALKQSDYVLIPVVREVLDLKISLSTIKEIERHNKNIIIVANRTKKNDYEQIKKVMSKFYDYPIFNIKQSQAIPNLLENKISIRNTVNKGGLQAYHYKKIDHQFNELFNFIAKES